jgi:hypothetical protein
MSSIPNFKKFNHDLFISEAYELVMTHMSYDEFTEIVSEGFFDFIKGIFTNPIQKRKLDKFGKDLLKTKIELMKLEIEEDDIELFKMQLNQVKNNDDNNYEITSSKVNNADKAKSIKIKTLQDRESILINQMDEVGKDSVKLQKYVDSIKFEIRIKANDATIKLADSEIAKILKSIKNEDIKTIKTLNKEINKK